MREATPGLQVKQSQTETVTVTKSLTLTHPGLRELVEMLRKGYAHINVDPHFTSGTDTLILSWDEPQSTPQPIDTTAKKGKG